MYPRTFFRAALAVVIVVAMSGCSGSKDGTATDKPSGVMGQVGPDWYDAAWSRVDSLQSRELPRSVLEVVDEIYETSKRDNNEPHLVKSLVYRMRLRLSLEEADINAVAAELRQHAETSSPAASAVFESLLGDVLWSYMQANRYQIYERTAVAVALDDLETWDVSTLVNGALKHYRASLDDADVLLDTSVDAFETIIEEVPDTRRFRPTLFDVLAHRALDVFENSEAGLTQPREPFVVTAEDHLIAAAEFVQLAFDGADSLSLRAAALKTHRDLIDAHLSAAVAGDGDHRAALVHSDLRRLRYVRNQALDDDGTPYLEAVQGLRDTAIPPPAEVAADIEFAIAQELMRQGQSYARDNSDRFKWKVRDALAACREVATRYPGTWGARRCAGIESQALARNLQLETTGAVPSGESSLLSVTFRNVKTVYLRVYPLERAEMLVWNIDGQLRRPEFSDRIIRERTPVFSTEFSLPDDGDHQSHRTPFILRGLDRGTYVLVAGDQADLNRENGTRFVGSLQVSDLSYFTRNGDDGSIALRVVDRSTGLPREGVEVALHNVRGGRTTILEKGETYRTDRDGAVTIASARRQSFQVELKTEEDWLASASPMSSWVGSRTESTQPVTRFFTDRAIYRPGQQVYFKGILLERKDDRYTIRPDAPTAVRFFDPNGRELAFLNLRSNEFGTVSGQFTAPTGGLTGMMSIRDPHGNESVRVEEYKRPRFEVTLSPLEEAVALGDDVTLRGSAKSFAGAAIDGGQVSFRVERTAFFPWRHSWWGYRGIPRSNPAIIAHGTLETSADGSFEVQFEAKPDPTVQGDALPAYNYAVTVEVVDRAGETQSDQTTVRVGERSLLLSADIPGGMLDRDEAESLTVRSRTLDGAPVEAAGRIEIARLEEPAALLEARFNFLTRQGDTLSISREEWQQHFPHMRYPGTSNPATWDVSDVALSAVFGTAGDGQGAEVALEGIQRWQPGMYRVRLTAQDPSGRDVETVQHLRLIDSDASTAPGAIANWLYVKTPVVEPGESARYVLGTAAAAGAMLLEVEYRGKVIESRWVRLSREQRSADFQVVEAYRGNVAVHTTMVQHNQMLRQTSVVQVPWSNKELTLEWGTFRDKLEPGQEETWSLRVRGPQGDAASAEIVATLYDASLDQFVDHGWQLDLWPRYGARLGWRDDDYRRHTVLRAMTDTRYARVNDPGERRFDQLLGFIFPPSGYARIVEFDRRMVMKGAVAAPQQEMAALADDAAGEMAESAADPEAVAPGEPAGGEAAAGAVAPPLRSNFDETAFFRPSLRVGPDGETVLTFKMPESLTRWRFMGLAHTAALETGMLEAEVVTQKELMISANTPRFLRQGDEITFTATVDNLSAAQLAGDAGLELLDAETMQSLFSERRSFASPAGQSDELAWTYQVPDNVQAVTVRVDAQSPGFTDGEEIVLPVLTNRMLVTESLPLPMRGPGRQEFRFDRLLDLQSETLRHERVVLEYTANPVWYAVQALPYLMEYPYECAEQVFSRLYANGVATYIVEQNPEIVTVFETWKRQSAQTLLSNLERNQELKSLLLEETPWVRQAKDESERKRRLALLFDFAQMRGELAGAITKLEQLQLPSGAWPWFAGGRENRYITQHIVKGIGAMRRMGVLEMLDDGRPLEMAQRALAYLDGELVDDYKRLLEDDADLDEQQVSMIQLHALYARSFFGDVPPTGEAVDVVAYYLDQLDKYALSFETYGEGLATLVLHRADRTSRALELIASLREKALRSEELGMYWSLPRGWWWYQAPIETQSLLIEAFGEVADDTTSVSEMQLWLLKQKQTQDWKTTRATTDAVYALLQRGPKLLDNPGVVEVQLGTERVSTEATGAEAGTGYVKASWSGAAISRDLGEVTVSKTGPGPAWGALYWQYFEDLDKITAAETPLQIEKQLFVRRTTDAGATLVPISASEELRPGELLTVRVVIRVDRDMEYVHLKDMRASGLEPVNVLSGYRWQGGLGYYESTRDAATNFFISYLPRGTHVFEYPLRVRHAGDFSNGITTIQSMYAPEFAAHSEGIRIRVGR